MQLISTLKCSRQICMGINNGSCYALATVNAHTNLSLVFLKLPVKSLIINEKTQTRIISVESVCLIHISLNLHKLLFSCFVYKICFTPIRHEFHKPFTLLFASVVSDIQISRLARVSVYI